MQHGNSNDRPTDSPPRPSAPLPAVVESHRLLAGRDRVLILHHGETYVLRRTRQGKLILTK
ncbi:MAG: hemin uptake protein HemP [Chromatiaceae bacterium]|nr:hemin uptake protein HemP [Gammaproteobacteria bacterium]MCP5301318.1 hemin uptake protein HemP [Chromatiaceae bacterium]MCP5421916.1 hemin uptake protein HemP [Chromatiaceae bacterium]